MFLIDLDKQALENRCKNCGNCVNYDGVRCSIDNVPCSSDDFCGHHELKISKGNTPPKEEKTCKNCEYGGKCLYRAVQDNPESITVCGNWKQAAVF